MFTWDEIYEIKPANDRATTRVSIVRKKDQVVVAPNLKNRRVAENLAERLADEHRKVIEEWLLGDEDD